MRVLELLLLGRKVLDECLLLQKLMLQVLLLLQLLRRRLVELHQSECHPLLHFPSWKDDDDAEVSV